MGVHEPCIPGIHLRQVGLPQREEAGVVVPRRVGEAPVLGIDLPAEDCDELEVRIPFTAFARPINLIGWAGLAIGDLQLIAPHDETVLAAGLAWERG